jgi:hypothetical protein
MNDMRAGQHKTHQKEPIARQQEENSLRAHSKWVRSHPRIDDSAFPEYPDEAARRGASRGALPNGNPWRPEDPKEKPGPTWARPAEPVAGVEPRTIHVASQLPSRARRLEAPPTHPAPVAVSGGTQSRAERRLAQEVASRLSFSKTFDGKILEVDVHDQDVFLRGQLPTLEAKMEAGLVASSVRRVARVHNQIRLGKRG